MTQIWSKADLHMHSSYSDGAHGIRRMLGYVAEHTDLRIIAITDHDAIDGALLAHRIGPAYGLDVIVGEEVSTTRGHLLALFIREYIPPGLSLPETVERVHDQGGLAILAHALDRFANSPMRRWPRPTLEDWAAFNLDGLEALNGSQIDPQAFSRATDIGRRLGLAVTGGSDAHHSAAIGVAHTLFPGTTIADLRYAMQQRICLPEGRRWHSTDYARWFARSLVPGTIRAIAQARPIAAANLP